MGDRWVPIAFMVAVALAAAGGVIQVSANGTATVIGAGLQLAGVFTAVGTLGSVFRKVRRGR